MTKSATDPAVGYGTFLFVGFSQMIVGGAQLVRGLRGDPLGLAFGIALFPAALTLAGVGVGRMRAARAGRARHALVRGERIAAWCGFVVPFLAGGALLIVVGEGWARGAGVTLGGFAALCGAFLLRRGGRTATGGSGRSDAEAT